MSIIINEHSRILIQGITGKTGRYFADRMLEYGSPLKAGVTPGKGGEQVLDIPVYNDVQRAVLEHNVDVSLVSVPPPFVRQAVLEAIDAGIKIIVIYSEGVPVQDSIHIVQYAKLHGVLLFGPNSAGIVSPGKANVSDIHDSILKPGRIGIVSRSGTLTYEVVDLLQQMELGISTIACLGGDPIIGVQHDTVLSFFDEDEDTDAVVYIGEIGGEDERRSAEVIERMSKPVFAYIAGKYAPSGKQMGHAGAIIRNELETADAKQRLLRSSGAFVADVLPELKQLLISRLTMNQI